jgi:hypothetical protein
VTWTTHCSTWGSSRVITSTTTSTSTITPVTRDALLTRALSPALSATSPCSPSGTWCTRAGQSRGGLPDQDDLSKGEHQFLTTAAPEART